MKKLIVTVCCLLSFGAMAASVKVGSFNFVRTSQNFNSPLAELCGSVEGATSFPSFIRVHVDYNTNNSAIYNTLAGEDGKFCVSVITYRGRAQVSLIGENSTIEAEVK
ncbi:MAG: hypothetical protein ACLGHN_00105 [Bacteriovoracia bacterium]